MGGREPLAFELAIHPIEEDLDHAYAGIATGSRPSVAAATV
jgi:hypothetical protein